MLWFLNYLPYLTLLGLNSSHVLQKKQKTIKIKKRKVNNIKLASDYYIKEPALKQSKTQNKPQALQKWVRPAAKHIKINLKVRHILYCSKCCYIGYEARKYLNKESKYYIVS